jgi:HEAT repeat protein/acetolactate synthase small subunit
MGEYSTQFLNDLIKQVGMGINISKTYPKGHPSLMPVVKRLRILLREVPIEKETLSLVIVEDIIMIENERLDSKRLPIIASLVKRFNQIGVKSITFNVEQTEDDIKEFFNAMAATPADIEDYGDIVALMRARGITSIRINKFRVGVISSDGSAQALNWDQFLDSLTVGQAPVSDDAKIKELSGFLANIGIGGNEPVEMQSSKIVSGLEKLALMVADQYGEDRWDEYSLVFSRMLSVLSPTIKKNIAKYRTENKKLAILFKSLIPSMSDEDIIDVISVKAKEKTPHVEQEVIDILKNVTGARLPGILSSLRVNVPELDFETIAARLMSELKTVKGTKAADKFKSKNMEHEMREIFPRLRDTSHEERIKAITDLLEFIDPIFTSKNFDLLRLLIDRFDTMADAETDLKTFSTVIDALKDIYVKAGGLKKDDIVHFVSKKFGKHLLRKDVALLDRKKIVIKTIEEVKDENYVAELVSLLWDPGTFVEARAALAALSEFSVPVLIDTLKDTENRAVRMKIIDVIIKMGERAVPGVTKLLQSKEWYVRRNGVFMLGEMRINAMIDRIGNLIQDENEQVQIAVLESLSKIEDKGTKHYYLKALDSKYRPVVVKAMEKLERDDVQEKIVQVTGWLASRKGIPDPKEEAFRQEIIALIGRYGDDSVLDVLVSILSERPLFKADILRPTKLAVLNALVNIGSKNALAELHDAAKHKDQFVSASAEEILRKLESKQKESG